MALAASPSPPSPQNGGGRCRRRFAIVVASSLAHERIRTRAGKMQSLTTHLQPLHQSILLVCNHSLDDLCNRNKLLSYAGLFLQVVFLPNLSLFLPFSYHLLSCIIGHNMWIKLQIRMLDGIRGFNRSWLSCKKNTRIF